MMQGSVLYVLTNLKMQLLCMVQLVTYVVVHLVLCNFREMDLIAQSVEHRLIALLNNIPFSV